MYGEETLRQVADQSQRIAQALDAADGLGVRVVWKPVLTDADAIGGRAWTLTPATAASA